MEEKQYRCLECDAKFSTSELLQNHSRRHGMSINLPTTKSISAAATSQSTPSLNKGSLSAGMIGFVDETPTPTRFIRNCEEVGLFQDLQNVNPFDEDFKKAAGSTATPSGEATGFEFTFSSSVIGVLGTPNIDCGQSTRNTRSKRRYSEQDTLNTPQVFPYFSSTGGCNTLTTNTASMSACLTPTPQDSLTNENLSSGIHTPTETCNSNVSTTSYNHEEHVSIIAYTSAISQQTNNKNDGGVKAIEAPKSADSASKKDPVVNKQERKASSLKERSKANLKLDLKTLLVKDKFSNSTEKGNSVRIAERSEQSAVNSEEPVSDIPCKSELLERNRAAAHRSRERRKQWIYGLESRCRALETLLAQSQAEVARLRSENEALKSQIQNHNMDVVRLEPEDISIHSVPDDSIVIHHHTSPDRIQPQPVIQEPLADNVDASDIVIVSPIVLPTVKAKRGRPRKGEERRVPILAVPMNSAEGSKILPKIPILPISQPLKKS